MANPFPGMNPYLEDPNEWGDVHHRLMTYIADALQVQLPRMYAARLNIRVYVDAYQPRIPVTRHHAQGDSMRVMRDDVSVLVLEKKARETLAPYVAAPTMLNVPPPAEPLIVFLEPLEEHEAYIEIVRLQDEHIVTLIEVLSPTNKKAGEGRGQYLRKQRELLESDTHLVEIDLLANGMPTLAVLQGNTSVLPPHRYLINVRRAPERYRFEVYPVKLQERLPRIRIPLMKPDPDVALDIQAVLNQAYDNGAYDRLLNYHEPPHTTLAADEAKWVDELLRQKNL
ncbi:MAG: DUF4058 family protein [Chloroflexi bacterium]|nr:DUF4058 family protein [Chloroflexota bacterium]